MNEKFVNRFMENKDILKGKFSEKHPNSYLEIIQAVIEILHNEEEYDSIDPKRIHEIDDGNYQGTLIYIIGSSDYQPRDYWYVFVDYGSCSCCDTLEGIRSYSDDKPTQNQIKEYMDLALHIVQNLKKLSEEL